MSYSIADGQLAESRVAEFNSQHSWMSREVAAQQLAVDIVNHPTEDGAGYPYSGDHLGTFAHRETTPYGDPGDEIRRERIHTADVNVWAMIQRAVVEDFAA
ncbi:hypothetical protein SEA_MAGRITTE_163 [Microbacterium phage Magritte]|nr:hypothetical protein SEA_MAGRITTE_163 [Microbacterium phage Magritte]